MSTRAQLKWRRPLQGDKYHGIGCCCSVTMLRRQTVHLPAPVFGNRNPDAICGLRPTTGGQAAGALSGYLGTDKERWRRYDACALLEDGARLRELLVDQGVADQFLESQLKPQLLKNACAKAGVPLTLRMHEGYDHSYFFISSFIEDHLRWHAQRLGITTAR
jgi:S-formylglutathione hydrolase FrmB